MVKTRWGVAAVEATVAVVAEWPARVVRDEAAAGVVVAWVVTAMTRGARGGGMTGKLELEGGM